MNGRGEVSAPTGTVTFLFTDIEGSTPMWDQHPDTMGRSLARHDDIVRSAIGTFGGHVFSTGGDGFGAAFASVGEAVDAAVDAQIALTAEDWGEHPPIKVRMGLHTGEAEERGGDYFGPPVNQCARIMAAAHGGQIVTSALTGSLITPATGLDVIDLGSVTLKGFADPIDVAGVAGRGHAWLDVALVTHRTSVGNLPRPATQFVGTLDDLRARFGDLTDARVVTLTGSGGVGKTRASIEVGWMFRSRFPDGVWFVELAAVADPDGILPAIAATLGVRPQPNMTLIEAIVDWAKNRRMMVIIDNCEHVLGPVAGLVGAVTAECSTVTVVATSREPLGVSGESVVRIPSLEPHHGVEMFVMRAVAAEGSFLPTPVERDAISSICERLDGIPLAIELAAARTRSLSPTEIVDRLGDRFRLLRGGGRGGMERHQTLRATVAWSYQLLSSESQLLFDRLSVFAGSFDLTAAEATCAGGDIDELDLIDHLSDLVDKSMVLAHRAEGATRYRLLETLRQFGEERLEDRTETSALRNAHLSHFVALGEHLGSQWNTPKQAAVAQRFETDWDNFRAAHDWAITNEQLDSAVSILDALAGFGFVRTRLDLYDWAEQTLALCRRLREFRSIVPGLLAQGAWIGSNPDRAVEMAALAGDDLTDEGAALARCWQFYALISTGRIDEVIQLLPDLDVILNASLGWPTFLAAHALTSASLGTPHATEAVERLENIADGLGSAYERSESRRLRALIMATSTDEPDLDTIHAEFSLALDLAESVGSDLLWIRANRCLLPFDDVVVALSELRDVLADSHAQRNRVLTSHLLEGSVIDILIDGSPHAAATLLGHAELQPPGWGPLGERVRSDQVERLANLSELATLRLKGAALDHDQAVDFALNALSDTLRRRSWPVSST